MINLHTCQILRLRISTSAHHQLSLIAQEKPACFGIDFLEKYLYFRWFSMVQDRFSEIKTNFGKFNLFRNNEILTKSDEIE